MPKEQINTPVKRMVSPVKDEKNGDGWGFWFIQPNEVWSEAPAGSHVEDTPIVYLGWRAPSENELPGQSITLTVEVAEEEILRMAEEIMRERKDPDSTPELADFVWHSRMKAFHTIVLSREEMNKAIRSIRRARNAVYGVDE